jgi:hypothetical protein
MSFRTISQASDLFSLRAPRILTARADNSAAAGPEGCPGPGLALPKGSVASYWGSLDELPKGYELCDGELVTTPDSPSQWHEKASDLWIALLRAHCQELRMSAIKLKRANQILSQLFIITLQAASMLSSLERK